MIKNLNFFLLFTVNFPVFVHQPLDLDPDRLSKSRGPDPGSCNTAKGYFKKSDPEIKQVWISYRTKH